MSNIDELKDKIAEASEAYWDQGYSNISDPEYDALIEELKSLTGEDDAVGSPKVTSSGKVKHPVPMLSMQKVYTVDKVISWAKKYSRDSLLLVMPKYDGIALVRYPDGTVATRGDGKLGEIVTDIAADLFSEYPPQNTPLYGECVCTLNNLEKMNALGYDYKNPRNAVSGIMSGLDPGIQKRVEYLTFIPYTAVAITTSCEGGHLTADDIERGIEAVHNQTKNIPKDGVVFRVADSELFESLGHTDHHWRGQVALKNANDSAISEITDVSWRENNGTVTPIATIKPIILGGAEIGRVTLHNSDRVQNWDIRVGDRCVIERAGGVIPKIIKTEHTAESTGPTPVPTVCPTCGTTLKKKGARLFCGTCDK